ncbi:hypothetical protein PHISCL_05809 [Aspergillus sclerotialis]|uniref:Uncharacterized protein n=1 Tax=Aspergillus sclerotialis TaxID=2070753 RepID=A0A3A2ZFA7_9EURO|nr:hypothetical protein PHISCL_05809 [Aspergillus sclerotialis]
MGMHADEADFNSSADSKKTLETEIEFHDGLEEDKLKGNAFQLELKDALSPRNFWSRRMLGIY